MFVFLHVLIKSGDSIGYVHGVRPQTRSHLRRKKNPYTHPTL